MKKLAILLIVTNVVYGQSFDATVYDLDSGRIQVIDGGFFYDYNKASNERLARLRQINSDMNAQINATWQQIQANQQIFELQTQTKLLQQIANK